MLMYGKSVRAQAWHPISFWWFSACYELVWFLNTSLNCLYKNIYMCNWARHSFKQKYVKVVQQSFKNSTLLNGENIIDWLLSSTLSTFRAQNRYYKCRGRIQFVTGKNPTTSHWLSNGSKIVSRIEHTFFHRFHGDL